MESRKVKHSKKKSKRDKQIGFNQFLFILYFIGLVGIVKIYYPFLPKDIIKPLINLIQTTSIGYFSLIAGIICFRNDKTFVDKHKKVIVGTIAFLIFMIVAAGLVDLLSTHLGNMEVNSLSYILLYFMVVLMILISVSLFSLISTLIIKLVKGILEE